MFFIKNYEYKLLKKHYLYLKKYKYKFILLVIITILVTTVSMISPIYFGKIIDYVAIKDFYKIIKLSGIIMFIFAISAFLSIFETYICSFLEVSLTRSVKNDMFEKIITLNICELDRLSVGEWISRLESDAESLANLYIKQLSNFIVNCIKVVISAFFILKISLTMSIISFILFPLTIVSYYIFGKRIKSINKEMKKLSDDYYSFIQDSISGIREVKNLRIEDFCINKFKNYLDRIVTLKLKYTFISILSGITSLSISTIMNIILVLYGCWLIINNQISIGAYVAFNTYIQYFINSVNKVFSINIDVQSTIVSLKRIDEIFTKNSDEDIIVYKTDCKEIKINNQSDVFGIKFENVTFGYDIRNSKVIRNLSFNIEQNSLNAIVGLNGSGKSTILNLITRFYICESGSIYINGININKLDLNFIRSIITYIPQEIFLFNTSIKENLLLANPLASMDEIIDVCKKVKMNDFINTLPEKYNTIVGERGRLLSGGQKQRLAIARGLLRKSKIFLLDEITTGIDGETEKYILDIINQISLKHIIIIVSHNLSSVINVDNIMVIDNGKLINIGNHKELINNCRMYNKLFQNQFEN